MNFDLDETQTMLKNSAARWLQNEYDFERRRRRVAQTGCSESVWTTFAEMGWLGAHLPEEYGGFGGGPEEAALLMEEFGKALVVEPFLAIAVLAAQALIGSADKRAPDLLEAMVSGAARPVLAHAEPAARGEVAYLETTAHRDSAGWILNGDKALILAAPYATHFIVSARNSGTGADTAGISLFLVESDLDGISREDARLSDGARGSRLVFRDLKLPEEALLGAAGSAFPVLDRAYAHAITALCAEAVGAMDHALWMTRDYLRVRQQFGRPIGNFQALQHRMAEMLVELELARSSVYRAIAFLDAPVDARNRAVSLAKIQICHSAAFVGSQAVQLHGGIGVTEEYAIGHYFKRLTAIQNEFGTKDLHLARVARLNQAGNAAPNFPQPVVTAA
jgi:alkylation response protein AidB-like acyl-CoA dehydrogenase